MKLLLKEYLMALAERDELDRLLPEILSSVGLHVFSEPRTRGRQHGVDIAAAGRLPEDTQKRVYLFSVKAHDLTRADWDDGVNALRPSLNEILDTYLTLTLPAEYRDLPKVICICVGGLVVQQVRDDVNGYIQAQMRRTPNLEYQVWDGDMMAGFIERHYVSDRLLLNSVSTKLGRCVALPDEVEYFVSNFRELMDEIFASGSVARTKDPAFHVVCLNLCLAVLLHHGRDAGNVDAAYRAAEQAQLAAWGHLELGNPSCANREHRLQVFDMLWNLYVRIGEIYVAHLAPCLGEPFRFALSVEGAQDEVDVNLKAFDVLGRLVSLAVSLDAYGRKLRETGREPEPAQTALADRLGGLVPQMLENVHTLATPMLECQLSAISMAVAYLLGKRQEASVRRWVERIAEGLLGRVMMRKGFPTLDVDYEQLLDHVHDEHDEGYVDKAWPSSELIVYLLYLAFKRGWENVVLKLAEVIGLLPKTVLQIWFPGKDAGLHFADGGLRQCGLMLYGLDMSREGLVRQIEAAERQYPLLLSTDDTFYAGLPYVGFRQASMPLPPHLWLPALDPS